MIQNLKWKPFFVADIVKTSRAKGFSRHDISNDCAQPRVQLSSAAEPGQVQEVYFQERWLDYVVGGATIRTARV